MNTPTNTNLYLLIIYITNFNFRSFIRINKLKKYNFILYY